MKYLPWFLLILGTWFPTSIGGSPSTPLHIAGFALFCALLALMAWYYGVSQHVLLYTLAVGLVLGIFTFAFGLHLMPVVGVGTLAIYAATAFMFGLSPRATRSGLAFASGVNLLIGALLFAGIEPVQAFFTTYFNDYYDELLPSMFATNKPVLTFASHSVAGFFMYLFFWVNWREFRSTGKHLHLAFAIGHVALCICLMSHTSLGFAALALLQMLWVVIRVYPWRTAMAVALLLLCVWHFTPTEYVEAASDLADTAGKYWLETNSKTRSGFWGRFSEYGNMHDAIVYISDHPFSPIGVTGNPNMMLIDSGIIEHFVRGSLFLIFLMYGGLWFFLRRSLDYRTSLQFFLCVLLFEVGFNIVNYHRVLCLLPLMVAWLKEETPRELAIQEQEATSRPEKEWYPGADGASPTLA